MEFLPTLDGRHVRLEPLQLSHAEALVAASAGAGDLYTWSPVPTTREAAVKYIDTAIALRNAGKAVPFAVIRKSDNLLVGSTRFFDLENFAWPAGHTLHGRATPDVCEIGYTWYSPSAIRTVINTEAKLLMLGHAFEQWHLLRVVLHTDARNERSRAAIARIGGKFDGILRAHRMAADFTPRDSARFSIIAAEWPNVKAELQKKMDAH
ncbi:MAG TPA: GNAT family protein [Candidatus Koribacter sp.]|jgi:RimJ/RimL family protein N-acetyltransferase